MGGLSVTCRDDELKLTRRSTCSGCTDRLVANLLEKRSNDRAEPAFMSNACLESREETRIAWCQVRRPVENGHSAVEEACDEQLGVNYEA